MHLLRSVVLLASIHGMNASVAQSWVDMLMDDSTNIHVVKSAFDQAWEGRTYAKGKGWKQFQRWYWFNDQRTWPSGERLDPGTRMEAMLELQALRAGASGARDEAVWESLGPTSWNSTSYNPGNGRVNTVFADPDDHSVLYVGTPSAGLWRSTLDGAWEPLFTDLPSMGVSGIAIDTTGTGTIYIATGDGDGSDTYSAGVLKSNDNGATWLTTGLNWSITQSRTTRALRMHHSDPLQLFCAASNGLYRTGDAGINWVQVINASIRDVEFMPGDTTLLYACSDQFYRSLGGGTFTTAGITGLPSADEVGRMAVAVTPADPLIVYVLCSAEEDDGFLGLYRSADGGITFTLMSDSPNIFGYADDGSDSGGQAWYDMALAVDPQDANTVYIGGVNVWKSTDGGVTWEIRSHWVFPSDVGYTHADIHSLDFIGERLYCGSDGGIHATDDSAATWLDLSAGLDIMQFYRMGSSELMPQLVMAGAQDNGTNRYANGVWTHVLGADGMEAAVDPVDPSIVYGASQNGGLNRSDNGGVDWIGIGVADDGPWVTPYALNATAPGRIIAGFTNVWASDARGADWYQLTNWDSDESVRCLTMAHDDGSVIYAARTDRMERSLDGGFTWTDIRPGLPILTPTSFAVSYTDPMHVWVCFSGVSAGKKVYESTDGGLNWTNRSLDLPNTPVNSLVVQPGSPDGLYVGTDLGVFYHDNYTGGWQPYGVGMPSVVVSELEVNMAAGKLRAATYGRGIWEADLFFSPFASIEHPTTTPGPRLLTMEMSGLYLVQASASTGRLLNLRVLDACGRLVNEADPGRAMEAQVDLRQHSAGTYMVLMTTEKGTWCRRLVR